MWINMKTALIVGHKPHSPGACAPDICEYEFNEDLAYMISRNVEDCSIVYRDTYSGLPNKVNSINPDIILSLHCNAFNKKVSGTETLYYHKSFTGKIIAQEIQDVIVNILDLPDRGIKPKTTEDRGGYLLRYTRAPCIILEPFFIDNPIDLQIATDKKQELADGISKWLIRRN